MLGLKTHIRQDAITDEELLTLARKVVSSYVTKKSIPHREEADVTMAIIEKFLIKKTVILGRFKGESKFSTYCFAVLNRMCCEVIRNQQKSWNLSEKQDIPELADTLSQTDLLLIKEEIKLLHRIFFLFGSEKHKIKLFFAFFYQLQVLETHLESYDAKYKIHLLEEIFLKDHEFSKGEMYQILAEVIKVVENKEMKPDAVRMWMNKCRTTIIERLNANAYYCAYDSDSFQALFEYCLHSEAVERELTLELNNY
ncbi:MAG: hypothetical protein K9I34_02775 [Bacteroidales bacterium]|nr:hypothetical protein [Bacteroidales bacterium]